MSEKTKSAGSKCVRENFTGWKSGVTRNSVNLVNQELKHSLRVPSKRPITLPYQKKRIHRDRFWSHQTYVEMFVPEGWKEYCPLGSHNFLFQEGKQNLTNYIFIMLHYIQPSRKKKNFYFQSGKYLSYQPSIGLQPRLGLRWFYV